MHLLTRLAPEESLNLGILDWMLAALSRSLFLMMALFLELLLDGDNKG
jgi:hypothetical protein